MDGRPPPPAPLRRARPVASRPHSPPAGLALQPGGDAAVPGRGARSHSPAWGAGGLGRGRPGCRGRPGGGPQPDCVAAGAEAGAGGARGGAGAGRGWGAGRAAAGSFDKETGSRGRGDAADPGGDRRGRDGRGRAAGTRARRGAHGEERPAAGRAAWATAPPVGLAERGAELAPGPCGRRPPPQSGRAGDNVQPPAVRPASAARPLAASGHLA